MNATCKWIGVNVQFSILVWTKWTTRIKSMNTICLWCFNVLDLRNEFIQSIALISCFVTICSDNICWSKLRKNTRYNIMPMFISNKIIILFNEALAHCGVNWIDSVCLTCNNLPASSISVSIYSCSSRLCYLKAKWPSVAFKYA